MTPLDILTARKQTRETEMTSNPKSLTDWYRGVLRMKRDENAGTLILIFADEHAAESSPFYDFGQIVCAGGYMNAIELK